MIPPIVPAMNRLVLLVTLAALAGCSSLEYRVRESFGQQKRELLVDRVESARSSQESAKQQFVAALERFKQITGFQGGDLEAQYDGIKRQFDLCTKRAGDVSARIAAVDDVANALFREWERELKEYSSDALRQDSERKLYETTQAYKRLLEVMRNAEGRMAPVLATFKDQTLYLKHNLNARAIASLGGISLQLERDVDVLVADMQRAIDDADRFIVQMKADGA